MMLNGVSVERRKREKPPWAATSPRSSSPSGTPTWSIRCSRGGASRFVDRMSATIVRRNADAVRGKLPILVLVGTLDFLYERHQKRRRPPEEWKIDPEDGEVDGLKHDLRGLAKAMDTRTLEFAATRFVLPRGRAGLANLSRQGSPGDE